MLLQTSLVGATSQLLRARAVACPPTMARRGVAGACPPLLTASLVRIGPLLSAGLSPRAPRPVCRVPVPPPASRLVSPGTRRLSSSLRVKSANPRSSSLLLYNSSTSSALPLLGPIPLRVKSPFLRLGLSLLHPRCSPPGGNTVGRGRVPSSSAWLPR